MHGDTRRTGIAPTGTIGEKYAGVVLRLALDGGVTSAVAEDVCFVTLQNLAPGTALLQIAPGAGRVVRAALEQRAVARCLAAGRRKVRTPLHSVPTEALR